MTRVSPAVRATRRMLHRLARAHDVHTVYQGTDGRRHSAADDVLVAALAALGVGVSDPADAPAALRATISSRQRRVIEPVIVHRSGTSVNAQVSLDAHVDPQQVWIAVRREDGTVDRRRLDERGARLVGAVEDDGTTRHLHRFRLRRADLPTGYHELVVEGPGTEASALVVSAPSRLPAARRQWGLSVPLYALRTRGDWGVGSYRDLAAFSSWVGELGGSLAGTLPLYPAFGDAPGADASPYLPVSRLAWNELYVDVESVPELAALPEVAAQLAAPALREQLFRLRRSRISHPGATLAVKRRILEPMAQALAGRGARPSTRRAELDAWVATRPEILAYARFRAERERGGDTAVTYHLYVQWLADSQLAAAAAGRGTGAGLYLDLPIGVHPEGFDQQWAPDAFVTGVSAGAPPDDFFAGGQCWGFPPLHPEGIRAQGYRYVAAVLRHVMRHAAALRIDHVMGLQRLYWVPDGVDPRDGVYVGYRGDELHAVLALEAERAGTVVVGEDLGTVPTSVERAMARDRMLCSHVLQFESSTEDPLPPAPRRALASWGTHDLPPFAAYWRGLDIGDRRRRDVIDAAGAEAERKERARWRAALLARLPGTGLAALPADGEAAEERRALSGSLRHLAAGEAEIVLVDLEDLWLETEPQNRPGTGPEAGNFRRRAARTLEEAATDTEVAAVLREVDAERRPGLTATGTSPTDTHRSNWGGPT